MTARKSRLGGVGQISVEKYPRVVYAVTVDLKRALDLSTLGLSQAAEALRATCLDKNDLRPYVANWQRAYRRLFKVADLRKPDGTPKRCHCHMFRDTFAVEMLLAGVPIDQVSILLGHSSVRVTEKHYSPWVRARQDQLEKSVQSAWQLPPEHKAVAS